MVSAFVIFIQVFISPIHEQKHDVLQCTHIPVLTVVAV